MPDQLTQNVVTFAIDLACAKQPTRLPANFGVRNQKCNEITKPQQALDCMEPGLKPWEPSDQAGPPIRREMTKMGRRISAQPMGGSKR